MLGWSGGPQGRGHRVGGGPGTPPGGSDYVLGDSTRVHLGVGLEYPLGIGYRLPCGIWGHLGLLGRPGVSLGGVSWEGVLGLCPRDGPWGV